MERPLLLIVDARTDIASRRAKALQDEAGDSLEVLALDTVGATLDATRSHAHRVAAVVAEQDLAPGVSGLALLARMSRECPDARRILVTSDLQRTAREREYAYAHAAFETTGRFSDIASGIVQDALEAPRARRGAREAQLSSRV